MTLEVSTGLESRAGTEPALDLANRATSPGGLRRREQRLVPHLERSRKLVLRFLLLLLLLLQRFLLHWHTPHNPNPHLFHPPLLETRSLQGSVLNSLRIRGRVPLRSASRLLGFLVFGILSNGLWRVLGVKDQHGRLAVRNLTLPVQPLLHLIDLPYSRYVNLKAKALKPFAMSQ